MASNERFRHLAIRRFFTCCGMSFFSLVPSLVVDWRSGDIPEIKVELISNAKVGKFGGGSEAANALAAPANAAAFHDATGKTIRRLPMKPAYVLAELKA